MAGPYDDATRTSYGDTVNPAKQRTAQQDDRNIVEGKQLWARRPIGEQSRAFVEKQRREERYRNRLVTFWSAAHLNSSAEDKAEREIFLRTMIEVSEDMAVLVTDAEMSPLPDSVIAGSPQEVDTEIAELLPANPGESEIMRFSRSSLGPTIERLERAGEGTPETRADIVARVLFALRGSPSAARLGCDLFRYLQSQEERGAGYYQTVLNLAVIVSRGGPNYVVDSIFLYHAVLDGFCGLFAGQRLVDTESSRNLVSVAGSSLARILDRRVRARNSDTRVQAVPVLRDLRTISAATCSVPSFDDSESREVATVLRLPASRAPELLAVLIDMAEMAEAWGFGDITVSELEASGGVAAAASGNTLRAVDLLHNAGISLRTVKDLPASQVEILSRARMLINAAGLRLAIATQDDLYASLVDLDGIDCAVAFIGTLVEYGSSGDADVLAQLAPLANEIAHLAKWPLLQGVKRQSDLSKIERAATLMEITIDVRSTFPALKKSLQDAIEVLRTSLGLRPQGSENVVMDTASIIGSLYSLVLPEKDGRSLQSLVVDIVLKRDAAMQLLTDRYRDYLATTPDDVGLGPAVAAGVVTEAEWLSVAERLLDPLTSLVAAIAEFSYPRDGATEADVIWAS